MARPNEKDHRSKKSQGAAEFFRNRRFEQNAARGKQVWAGGSIKDGGHWERINAGQ